MKQFYDLQGELVKFSTQFNQFSFPPRDVLVLTKWDEDWLFTKHKERGVEFPGGKIESGETTEEAARREVYEETGAILSRLMPIAEYQVGQGDRPFVKRVFFGEVERLEKRSLI
ncbi:NUDIX domain-containing protein [Bacillus coahuilensis]|uniref:NUDIX domain-containing protein n=1 Tax=Bacillus coahuilensis TaxID=408580 RepID=UPI00018508C8|nr:NUDIX domain-containing protein [Bacillus coahuilensis]